MELEDGATVLLRPDPRLPVTDIETIAARLEASNALTPGFIPPGAGLLSIPTMLFAEHVEQIPTIFLPDRNVITRMARIARDGVLGREDPPSRLALDLMAYAQAMNVGIEPGLAMQELAQCTSNENANEELRWFRAADEGGHATMWINLAVGREKKIAKLSAMPNERLVLDRPIHRWRCNYAVMLKAASLELDDSLSAVKRFEALIEWMVAEFILAGPAAIFCAMFLAPFAQRAGLVKFLKSPDRAKALGGVRNAAWDVTYLSELVSRSTPESYGKARCIFASADRSLADIAPLLLIDAPDHEAYGRELTSRIVTWWRRDAGTVVDTLVNGIKAVEGRAPPEAVGVEDYVGAVIANGEEVIRRSL